MESLQLLWDKQVARRESHRRLRLALVAYYGSKIPKQPETQPNEGWGPADLPLAVDLPIAVRLTEDFSRDRKGLEL